MSTLHLLPCLDSAQMAASRRQELDIPRDVAAALGRSAVNAARSGRYVTKAGQEVVWRDAVQAACAAKRSIAPDATLPRAERSAFTETQVQVTNETTLGASRRLVDRGLRPLALNFANGIQPGGGFLSGARAQEEVLCRSSALYQTLVDDPMYQEHRKRPQPDSTDWAIYSPDVPVFRMDDGMESPHPWLLSFVTCAAPYAPVLANRKLETSYRSGFIACSLLHRLSDMPRSCWAHGVVALLRMIRTVLPGIFDRRWKMISAGRSPTSSLPSQIGRRRGSFLGLSVMLLPPRTRVDALRSN